MQLVNLLLRAKRAGDIFQMVSLWSRNASKIRDCFGDTHVRWQKFLNLAFMHGPVTCSLL